MNKESFILFAEQREIFESLTDKQAGQLIKAIFEYESTRKIPELDKTVKVAFIPIKQMLDKNYEKYIEKCEQNKANGKKGGRPKNDSLKTINGEVIPDGELDGRHFLYLIYDNYQNQYKIGETKNLYQRRYDIKRPTNNLDIVAFSIVTTLEAQQYESEILKHYKKYSVGGDWFELPREKVEEILDNYFTKKPNGYFEKRMVSKKP